MTNTINFHRNPEFIKRMDEWEMFRDMFEGNHRTMTSPRYLWLHEFEFERTTGGATRSETGHQNRVEAHNNAASRMRQIREENTRYFNLVEPIIKRFVNLIFKGGIDTSEVEDIFTQGGKDLMRDVDGNGTTLQNFIMNQIAGSYFLYGKVLLFTDSFGITARSKQEEIQRGLRPYWEVFNPLEVPDWQFELKDSARRGRFNFVRCEFNMMLPRDAAWQKPKVKRFSKVLSVEGGEYVARLYEGQEIKVDTHKTVLLNDDVEWKLVSEAVVPAFSEIPVASHDTESWIKQAAPILLSRHNKQSGLDNILHYQAYQKVIASGAAKFGDRLDMHEGVWTFIPGEANIQIIDPVQPTSLEKRIDQLTAEALKVAFNMQHVLPGDSREMPGAEAMIRQREDFIDQAKRAAQEIEDVVNEGVKQWAKFMGRDEFDGRIHFNTDLTVEDFDQELAAVQAFADRISLYSEVRKGVDLRMVDHLNIPNAEEAKRQIEDEETASPVGQASPERQALLNQALGGNGTGN